MSTSHNSMTTDTAVKQLQVVVDKLIRDGIDTVYVMLALAEVTVVTARRDPCSAVVHLEGAAGVLSAAARGLRSGNNAPAAEGERS